jgi:hypothetical protein
MTEHDTTHWTQDMREAYDAVVALNAAGRTTNTSQVASRAGLPRGRAQAALQTLQGRHAVKDTGKGSAYHWRVVHPLSPEEAALVERQREMNAALRKQ